MEPGTKIRVVLAKVSLDGHDRGIKVVTRALRDAGMEVIFMGAFQTPEKVVRTAIEEDADVIGLSFLSGEQLTHTPKVINLLREKNITDVLVILGGVFPRQDIPKLREMGVDEVFISGSSMDDIIKYINENVRKK
ncbi:MAG: methylmalonyl-CoA mutase [Deltaproteobacteria bacterium CG_4_8_14_3_um_filter_43_13]|nr:MAG: methylmalonyl-CoA mutase [Deltaproteobacteria bacterium CG2_30_43_15]PIU84779.1 MAG: methylmalonyl-CoA mutase [Deltaproteobacteria bacterium CG06_land_8_20_14_3_00_44_19]PIX24569.1 MAG: methylmalonyl-CoA mutase [Deltaproteobacteria bacterium CG_4_8_14_3_um_filter_43_13]PIZ19293.1 MAG: methylmalonyl-CoA mutase [Deltaproteobacteria bacterium CG_4_10_14_0_8_um_filter_43_12]